MKKLDETNNSKLSLNTETIRSLTADELLDANGGRAQPQSSARIVCSACPNCCPSIGQR